MKTIQMTLDEQLITQVDKTVKKLGTTRSAFTRTALRDALRRLQERELEEKHRRGYENHPVQTGEFDDWENEQAWVDS